MRLAKTLFWLCGAQMISSCGFDPTAASQQSPVRPSRDDASFNVSIAWRCELQRDQGDNDPEPMKVYRHPADADVLKLSIEKLPMVCADSVSMSGSWRTQPGALTLDVRGHGYKHCLCSFDFEPFTVGVPASLQASLESQLLVVKRGDSVDQNPLQTTMIGDLLRP